MLVWLVVMVVLVNCSIVVVVDLYLFMVLRRVRFLNLSTIWRCGCIFGELLVWMSSLLMSVLVRLVLVSASAMVSAANLFAVCLKTLFILVILRLMVVKMMFVVFVVLVSYKTTRRSCFCIVWECIWL